MENKANPKVQQMVEKYKAMRVQGWNHAAAAHSIMTGIRGSNRKAIVDAFLAVPEIAAEGKKFNAEIEL